MDMHYDEISNVGRSLGDDLVCIGEQVRHEADKPHGPRRKGTPYCEACIASFAEETEADRIAELGPGDPCPRCDAPLSACSPSGRGTAACDNCQTVYVEET